MKTPARSYKGSLRALCCAAMVLVLTWLPMMPGSSARAADRQSAPASRTINEYEVAGRFLEEWSRQGSDRDSIYVNGLPITPRRSEISLTDGLPYDTQWLERARYELHPLNAPPYDVLLGLLGVSLTEGRGVVDPGTGKVRDPADQAFVGVERPPDADGVGKVWFGETRHTVGGKILEYWKRYGGLRQFGFPLSEPFEEQSEANGKVYEVQYFERARFELHPEKAAPYEVELGLLGVQQYRATAVPAEELPIAPPRGVKSSKDTLTIGMSAMPWGLFPFFGGSDVAREAAAPIFNSVVGSDGYGRLWPELAWYVPTVENGGAYYAGSGDERHLVVKYKLRRGIKWSDGVEVTVADLLYYYRLMLDPKAPLGYYDRSLQLKVRRIETPDKYTAVVSFLSYAQARDAWNTYGWDLKDAVQEYVDDMRPVVDYRYPLVLNALPDHILGKIPADKIQKSDYALQPVGTGPFMVESKDWNDNEWWAGHTESTITLVRNPNYNLTAPPLLNKIVFKTTIESDKILRQLRSGELDAAPSSVFTGGPFAALDTFQGTEQQVVAVPARVWEHIDFNLDKPGLNEKAVRQAIAYAINRQRIINEVYFGETEVLNTFLPPVSWASMQNQEFAARWESQFPLHKYDYNPEKAGKILSEAGWMPMLDGIRSKGGHRLSLTLTLATPNATRERIIDLLAQDLRQVGIAVEKYIVPPCYYCDPPPTGLDTREFEMYLFAWITNNDPSGQLYDSSLIPAEDNYYSGQNYPGYRNPRFDELSRAASKEIDRTKRAPMFAEMQSIWSEDLPALPLFARANIEVHKASLVGWETSGGYTPATYRAAALYFK